MDFIHPENLSLSSAQLLLCLPYFLMLGGGLIVLIAGVSRRLSNSCIVPVLSVLTVVAALASVWNIWGEPGTNVFNQMLAADYFSNLFNVVFLVSTLFVLLSSFSYIKDSTLDHHEYFVLLLMSCLGMMLLASSLDLVVLFVALEIMSIAVYVLVGFKRTDIRSNEAALKYFILGSAASAIFLYGAALVYGACGSLNIHEILAASKSNPAPNPLFVIGSLLLVVGFLFKVAAVPFHMWMPDVYEGAPTPVTAFMTTGLKAAAFASLLRVVVGMGLLENANLLDSNQLHNVLWVVAVTTMFMGNVIALTQRNIKRMLAYSSIAHTGYLIVGFLGGAHSEFGYAPVVMYLVGYAVMNLGAFAVVSYISEGEHNDLQDFAGLGFKRPALGFAMMVFLFSMAGVPPTAGFAGKYFLLSGAVQSGEIWLTVLAVLCSAISAYYYLRVVVYMYMKEPIREFRVAPALSAAFVVFATAFMTLQFGLVPSFLIHAARRAVQSLS